MKPFFAYPLASLPAAALFLFPGLLSAADKLPLRTALQRLQWIWSGEKPESPGATVAFETDFALNEKASSQEEQMPFAASLRLVSEDWPQGAREKFFRWFLRVEFHKAGHLAKVINDIRKDAVASLTDAEKIELEKVLSAPPESPLAPSVA